MISASEAMKVQRVVDARIAANQRPDNENSILRYREAVTSDAAALMCSDIFPEQLESNEEDL